MKRNWYEVLVIILFFISIVGYFYFSSNAYIQKANQNMDIAGLKLLAHENSLRDTLANKFNQTGGFGCNIYQSKNNDREIGFSGFPDASDSYVLTDVKTSNPDDFFYRIRVGDSIAKAEEILTKNRFSKSEQNLRHIAFDKKRLKVSLEFDKESTITEISIHLISTNKRKIIF